MPTGTVIWFAAYQKHYGFIKPDDGTGDVFIHGSRVLCNVADLIPGACVSYDLNTTRAGKLQADNVRLVVDNPSAPKSASSESFSDVVAYCKDSD